MPNIFYDTNSNIMLTAFLSGATAGLAVDLSLFPVDTIKTRLQSKQGFAKAGGFRSLYAGLGPVVLGSAPGAACFFATYESSRKFCAYYNVKPMYADMLGASLGEVMACTVRVPVDVVKQRAQTNAGTTTSFSVFRKCLSEEGIRGLFRGYHSTVLREIPFSLIQFPLWEGMKRQVVSYRRGTTDSTEVATGLEGACCGFISGGIAAAVTTPLDVAKTRIMLAQQKDQVAQGRVLQVLTNCVRQEGVRSLFAGVVPRTVFISFGGFIFLGTYEQAQRFL